MPTTPALQAFRAELNSIAGSIPRRGLVGDSVKERCRNLLRSWVGNIAPSLQLLVGRARLKLVDEELQDLANLTTKQKPARKYSEHLENANLLLNSLAIVLPPLHATAQPGLKRSSKLFSQSIPDLPLSFVPNSVVGHRRAMEAFVNRHSFDATVFIMIRYRNRNDALIRQIKSSLNRHSLTAVVARDHNLTEDLYNPIACLLCCGRGLAVFDRAEDSEKFNPNVAYELAMMHLLGRKCLILKHESLKTLQTDILMKLYEPYKTPADAWKIVDKWAKKELGFATDGE